MHLSGQDLARTTVQIAEQPLVETLFALELLARQGGGQQFAPWRQRTGGRLGRRARSLLTLARTLRPVPDLLSLVQQRVGAEREPGIGSLDPRRQNVAGMIEDFYKAALAPYWERISACLEADCAARARLVMDSGIEGLLSTLHPSVRWAAGVLEVPAHRSYDITPGGTGLVLTPSLFLVDRAVLIPATRKEQAPVLAYPVRLDPNVTPLSWAEPAEQSTADALGPLVGRTRAAIMKSLKESCTTTELGRRIGISAASASQHTSVLRSAGLITTTRRLNTALHSLTPLGTALLDGFHHQDLSRVQLQRAY
ncbi:winged helix-turn-helix domain-containing protein [Streptomyces sp. NPDC054864]